MNRESDPAVESWLADVFAEARDELEPLPAEAVDAVIRRLTCVAIAASGRAFGSAVSWGWRRWLRGERPLPHTTRGVEPRSVPSSSASRHTSRLGSYRFPERSCDTTPW